MSVSRLEEALTFATEHSDEVVTRGKSRVASHNACLQQTLTDRQGGVEIVEGVECTRWLTQSSHGASVRREVCVYDV